MESNRIDDLNKIDSKRNVFWKILVNKFLMGIMVLESTFEEKSKFVFVLFEFFKKYKILQDIGHAN